MTVNPGSSIFGDSAGVAGTGMITGKGFALVSTGDVTLGQRDGTGKLIVEDGGSATSKSEILVGYRTILSSGAGNLSVTGTGSTVTAGTNLIVGSGAMGRLRIGGGAVVTVTKDAAIGRRDLRGAGTGMARVTATGALLDVKGNPRVGGGATGTLAILAGGEVSIGGDTTVEGAGLVGNTGMGKTTINSGTRSSTGSIFLGPGAGSTGTLDVTRGTVTSGETIHVGATVNTGTLAATVIPGFPRPTSFWPGWGQ